MIYEWKCKRCGRTREVERAISNCDIKPDIHEVGACHISSDPKDMNCLWVRVYSSSVPFNTLRDRGIFMDQYGNFPPRNVE